MNIESFLLSGVSFLYAGLLFYFGLKLLLMEGIKSEEYLLHLNISWLILGLFWFFVGLSELFLGFNTFSPMMLIKILLFFAIPFLLEISLFYNAIFSNRISFIETYVPILIGFSFGLNLSSFFVLNEIFDNFVLSILTITGTLVFLEFIAMNKRFRKVLKSGSGIDNVSYFFKKILNVTFLLIIASTADIFIFISIIIDITLVSLASFIVFIFLLIITSFIIIENRKILINFQILDVSLILNEIN